MTHPAHSARRGALRLLLATAVVALVAGACSAAPPGSGSSAATTATDAPRRTETVIDDQGRAVELQVPVRSVVAFNTFNVEFIRAVGAYDTVLGLDGGSAGADYTGYWPGRDTSTTVGKGQAEPNYEQLAALKPEVVIFPRNGSWQDAEPKLAAFGIKTLVVTGWDQAKHVFNVDLIGKIFDHRDKATQLNAFYTRYKDLLATRLAGVTPKRVYLENDKDYGSPIPGSGWHDMIVSGGGTNIFGDVVFGTDGAARGSVHQFDIEPEAVLARDPQLVIRNTGGGYALASADDPATVGRALLARPGWDRISAVRDNAIQVTSSFPMNACSKIIGSLYVAKWLHPEKMTDIDPDAVMREWIETYQGVPLPDPGAYHRLATR
ncbi:iron ABC transporter substrate-binding protein [Pseudonocardia sulfidoxydans NBRC 16205]|uniref:Iron ABC transporter substrate-binding protein n=1 Tax=Pseudonocardia sulfidoxydans NBRC 16205 TaxID=1223511 RepID=A0A511DJP9_9PSEU|nr:ABC transporter substrate-binding protein [Pseudonocardia sulfidoxydans]GEL25036.1 iron ABC transporter substrate-binding protein [Pseudonocardia sulfidoxydans NBRC 16205]